MKNQLMTVAGLLFFAIAVAGCSQTADGVAKDTADNAQHVQAAAQKTGAQMKTAGDAASRSAKNAGDSIETAGEKVSWTSKVKLAIVADKSLNNPGNNINVDTVAGKVYLRGHVLNEAMRQRAVDVATKTLKQDGADAPLVDELKIKAL